MLWDDLEILDRWQSYSSFEIVNVRLVFLVPLGRVINQNSEHRVRFALQHVCFRHRVLIFGRPENYWLELQTWLLLTKSEQRSWSEIVVVQFCCLVHTYTTWQQVRHCDSDPSDVAHLAGFVAEEKSSVFLTDLFSCCRLIGVHSVVVQRVCSLVLDFHPSNNVPLAKILVSRDRICCFFLELELFRE